MNNQNLSPTPKVEGKGIQKLCYFGMSPFQFQKWHSPNSAAQLTRTGIVKCSKAQQNSFLFTWHKKSVSRTQRQTSSEFFSLLLLLTALVEVSRVDQTSCDAQKKVEICFLEKVLMKMAGKRGRNI